jgi:hypothetical protein
MQIAALIIVSFLGAWLFAYLDHHANFLDLFKDIGGLIFGMLMVAIMLSVAYGLLKLLFESSH